MQAAAMAPIAVDRHDVPQHVIEHELEIGRDKAREEGKPENMLDKIAEGRLNKFYQEATLLNQAFIKDAKETVKAYLAANDKELTVTGFLRFKKARIPGFFYCLHITRTRPYLRKILCYSCSLLRAMYVFFQISFTLFIFHKPCKTYSYTIGIAFD